MFGIGSEVCSDFCSGVWEDVSVSWGKRRERARVRSSERVEMSLPAPINPRPEERVTEVARGAVEMRRIGAEERRGLVVQG